MKLIILYIVNSIGIVLDNFWDIIEYKFSQIYLKKVK